MEWFAARTRSRHEGVVVDALRSRFQDVFLPTYRSCRWTRGRPFLSEKPLFPGYVFLRCRPTYEDWLDAKKMHGVVDLVGYKSGLPESIPDGQIDSVRFLVESGKARPHMFLRVGDSVKVAHGVFRGLTGRFVRESDTKGVLVLSIDLLGQAVSVEMDPHSVELY